MDQDPGERGDDEARLLRIVYVSHATGALCPDRLRDLEAVAASRNSRAGITGLLIAQTPYFYGVLEGRQGVLLDLMEVIITDHRHYGLRILSEEVVTSRRFGDWRIFALPGASGMEAVRPAAAFIFELSRRLSRR